LLLFDFGDNWPLLDRGDRGDLGELGDLVGANGLDIMSERPRLPLRLVSSADRLSGVGVTATLVLCVGESA